MSGKRKLNRKQARKPKCKVPECTNPGSYARGVCANCYKLLHRRVQLGETTWEKLVTAGFVSDTDDQTPVAKALKKLRP